MLDFKISRLQKAGAGMQAGQGSNAFPLKSASYTAVAAGTCNAVVFIIKSYNKTTTKTLFSNHNGSLLRRDPEQCRDTLGVLCTHVRPTLNMYTCLASWKLLL